MGGIYISNISVPKSKPIAIVLHPDESAVIHTIASGVLDKEIGRRDLVAVKNHGRLIDATELMKKFAYFPNDAFEAINDITGGVRLNIYRAPTVIPEDNE